jgi:hypothetical protein
MAAGLFSSVWQRRVVCWVVRANVEDAMVDCMCPEDGHLWPKHVRQQKILKNVTTDGIFSLYAS